MTGLVSFKDDFHQWMDSIFWPLFDALDQSAAAHLVKGSMTIVPWAGVTHLLAIALIGGAVLMVDMRVLGAGLKSQTPQGVQRTAGPLLIFGLIAAIVSGTVLALGELTKLYYSPPYWVKMGAFAAALLFTFTVRNRVVASGGRFGPVTIALAVLSVGLFAAVFIGYSSPLARMAMALLIAVLIIFAWLGREKPGTGDAGAGLGLKTVSAMSIVMWLTVAAAGRWIAFY